MDRKYYSIHLSPSLQNEERKGAMSFILCTSLCRGLTNSFNKEMNEYLLHPQALILVLEIQGRQYPCPDEAYVLVMGRQKINS